jgi:hypothetical protein
VRDYVKSPAFDRLLVDIVTWRTRATWSGILGEVTANGRVRTDVSHSDQAESLCAEHRRQPVADAELRVGVLEVLGHCSGANFEPPGDRLRGEALGEQGKNGELATGEAALCEVGLLLM